MGTTSENLARLTQRVDTLLADHRIEIDHFIDNGLGQAPELVFEMRSALRELQKLLHQLQEDPSQLIHRPPNDALEVDP
jgi:ABC-type transporter Mla subunit MlaD